jgi:hypothetical protein
VRRRSHRRWRGVLIALLVLLVLLLVADRAGAAIAGRTAATALQHSEHLSERPDVTIEGFPFLTQAVSSNFGRIKVTARDITLSSNGVRLRVSRLDVTLHQVHVNRDFSGGTSRSSTATALVTYGDLSQTLGATAAYAGNGRVRLAVGADVVPGLPVEATATAALRVSGDSLTFVDPQVTVGGQAVPAAATSYFAKLFGQSVPLSGLPFGVHVRSVQPGAGGVSISLTAGALTYHR